MLQRFSKFLLKLSFIRFVRSLFYGKFRPWLKRLSYLLIFLLIILTPYLLVKHQSKFINLKNKVVNEYIDFIDLSDSSYDIIKIIGNNYTEYDDISKIIKEEIKLFLGSKNDINSAIKSAKEKIIKLPWVKNVTISRNLPSNLTVKIEEYSPFAIWHDQSDYYIINKEGFIIDNSVDPSLFPNLIILSGKEANLHVKSLFNILATDYNISGMIYSATWVGLRRWDIRFDNGLLVRLPELNISDAWKELVKIYNTPGSLLGLKAIDLRVSGKVFLKYDDNSIKDLKSI